MPPLHSHASRYDRPLCGPLRTPARETICSRLAKSFLQLRSSFDRQRMFPATVCARPFCQLDSFSLPLTDQLPFELGERSHHAQQQVRHRRVFASEGQALFYKLNVNTTSR